MEHIANPWPPSRRWRLAPWVGARPFGIDLQGLCRRVTITRSTSLPLRCGTTCGLRGLTVWPDPCDRKEAVDRYRKTLPMSCPAMQRLSFFLLMGVTLYASLVGAG